MTIDQMAFNYSSSTTNPRPTVPWIENSQSATESIGVEMCPSLMGTFNFPAPVSYIRATPVCFQKSSPRAPMTKVTSFRTSYLQDPWLLPLLCESVEGHAHVGMAMPLSVVEVDYQTIQQATANSNQIPLRIEEDDQYLKTVWA